LAFTVASGSLDLAACVCVAIYLFLAYFALGMYAGKPAKALKRTEVQPELEEAQLAPPRRKRLVFNIANPEDAEKLMQLLEPPVKPSNTSALVVPTEPVSVNEDEAQQMLKLDSQTIGRLMLQDEQFAHKVAFLYAETRDRKLRNAISMAKWKVHWWLRK
jgi:hypothetical protein